MAPFRAATGLELVLLAKPGGVAAGTPAVLGLAPDALGPDPKGWPPFLRKMIKQAQAGDETLLFRHPSGVLLFAGPLKGTPGGPALTLVGSAGKGAGRPEEIPPRRLLELGNLARLCLEAIIRAHGARSEAAAQRIRVLTLFDLLPDLARAGSPLEVWGLALSTLGVLFDVESAAFLHREPGSGGFRVRTALGVHEQALLSWSVCGEEPGLEGLDTPGAVIRLDDPHVIGKLGLPEDVERVTLFAAGLGDRTTDVLLVANRALTEDEEALIRGFATQLGLVLENRRLQEEAGRRRSQMEAVRSLSHRFLGSLEPDDLYRAILEEARKLTGARKGSLMVPVNGNGELRIRAVAGMSGRVVDRLRVRAGENVAGHVYATGEPVLVENIERDPRFRRKNRPRYETKSFLSLPIRRNGGIVGVLNLSDKSTGEPFSGDDLDLLQTVASQATLAIERSAYYAQSRELRKISITDPLTGLLNRRYFQERLTEEVDRASRHGHPLALIMMDIDHFKLYNDTNGHPAGDKALVLLGRVLRASIRAIDVVSRFGGEEFAIILPETRKREALEIGERIRKEVESLYFPGEETQPGGRLTVSMGVAGYPEDARDIKALIQKADRALYVAKARGRNRIEAFTPSPASQSQKDSDETSGWTRVL